MEVINDHGLYITVALLVITGGIGFPVLIKSFFSVRRVKSVSHRYFDSGRKITNIKEFFES
jgi:Trk-type K+ transport system membrane component